MEIYCSAPLCRGIALKHRPRWLLRGVAPAQQGVLVALLTAGVGVGWTQPSSPVDRSPTGEWARPVGDDSPPVGAEVVSVQGLRREVLKQRVLERWQALIAQDFAKAYTFETPDFRRQFTPAQFKAGFGNRLRWRDIRWLDADMATDDGSEGATVHLELVYEFVWPSLGKLVESTSPLRERWIYRDDQWWHVNPTRGRSGLASSAFGGDASESSKVTSEQ